jgi:hypothetical protein
MASDLATEKAIPLDEILDAENVAFLAEDATLTSIGQYKGWALLDQRYGEIIDGEPMVRLKAVVPNPKFPGFFLKAVFEFTYYGRNAGERVDGIKEAKEFIDKFDYNTLDPDLLKQ